MKYLDRFRGLKIKAIRLFLSSPSRIENAFGMFKAKNVITKDHIKDSYLQAIAKKFVTDRGEYQKSLKSLRHLKGL